MILSFTSSVLLAERKSDQGGIEIYLEVMNIRIIHGGENQTKVGLKYVQAIYFSPPSLRENQTKVGLKCSYRVHYSLNRLLRKSDQGGIEI